MSSEIWSYMDGNYTWNDTDSWYGSYSPPDPAPLEIWLPTVIVYTVTFIVGLIGNILVLFAIQRCRRLRNVTNTFLASLATADLIIIVIVIPFQTPTYFQPTWELGEMMCKLLSYLTLLSSSCSVFMLTALSVERYFVIVHPLLAKSVITLGRARRIIISVWVSAVIYSFPPLYYKKERTWKFDNYDEFQTCVVYWPNDAWAKAFSLYLLLGMYIMPLLVMTYCYARIIHELWISTKRTQQLQNRYGCTLPRRTTSNVSNGVTMNGFHVSHTSMSRTRELGDEELKKCSNMNVRPRVDPEQGRKQVIVMLLAVVSLFMICWGPLICLVVCVQFNFISYSPLKTYLSIAFNLLSYLNSCMNPICYAFVSRTFRECFIWASRTCCRKSGMQNFYSHRSTSLISKSTSLYSRNSLNRSSSTLRTSATTLSSRQSPIVETLPWSMNFKNGNAHRGDIFTPGESNV